MSPAPTSSNSVVPIWTRREPGSSTPRTSLVGSDAFTLEAVAREAGVARVTVYDRFGGREALVEAIFDDLAESGGLDPASRGVRSTRPRRALERFVEIFCGFYSTHRLLLRRLHAMVVLDRNALGTSERDARGFRASASSFVALRRPATPAPTSRH